MKIKVMTYNVLYAFHEREGDAFLFHPSRAQAAERVVRAEAPDVLGVTEAVYCGARGRILRPDYKALFGLEHMHCAGFENDWGNCLMSRFPIVSAERLPLGAGRMGTMTSALRATLDCDGRALHVDLVHPSPSVTESERVEGFKPLLQSHSRPYVMFGDFNALSDEDPYDHATMVSELRGNVRDPEELATRMLDRQLIASVRAAGLTDTMPLSGRVFTLPTGLSRPHATQGARLRLDYIFTSPELKTLSSRVIKNADADAVSDHYPVVAELEL